MVQFIWPLKTIPCLLYCYKQHWCFTFTYCHLWLKQKCFKHTLAFKPSIVSWCKCAKNMVSCFCNATQFSTSILASNAKMPNLWCMAPPCCYHYKNQISKRSKNCQSKLLLAGILLTGLVLAAIQFFFWGDLDLFLLLESALCSPPARFLASSPSCFSSFSMWFQNT